MSMLCCLTSRGGRSIHVDDTPVMGDVLCNTQALTCAASTRFESLQVSKDMELSINARLICRRPTLTAPHGVSPLATVVPARCRPATLRLEVAAGGSRRRRRQRRRADRECREPTIDVIDFPIETGLVSQPLPTGPAVAIPVRALPPRR
jgi:hypothetical protein